MLTLPHTTSYTQAKQGRIQIYASSEGAARHGRESKARSEKFCPPSLDSLYSAPHGYWAGRTSLSFDNLSQAYLSREEDAFDKVLICHHMQMYI